MKKILIVLIFLATFSQSFALSQMDIIAANFLAKRGVIEEHYRDLDYNLDDNISRREIMKVVIKLSGVDAPDTCAGTFLDVPSSDWGCKYIEEALARGYISAANYFRPDDDVTKIEALKLIMKAKNIPKTNDPDWRVGYVQGGFDTHIIDGLFTDYNTQAVRGWIFQIGQDATDDTLLDVTFYDKKVLGPPPATGYSLEQRLVMQAAKARDIGNGFEIRQTQDYSYLYYNGNEIKSWYHLDMSPDFTWGSDIVSDLNCGQTIIGGVISYPTQEEYAQAWDMLPESQRLNCVRQQFYSALIVDPAPYPDFTSITLFHGEISLKYLFDISRERMYDIPFISTYGDLKIKTNSDGTFIQYTGINMPSGLLYIANGGEVYELYYMVNQPTNSIKGALYDFDLLPNGEIKLSLIMSAPTAPLVTEDKIITTNYVPK